MHTHIGTQWHVRSHPSSAIMGYRSICVFNIQYPNNSWLSTPSRLRVYLLKIHARMSTRRNRCDIWHTHTFHALAIPHGMPTENVFLVRKTLPKSEFSWRKWRIAAITRTHTRVSERKSQLNYAIQLNGNARRRWPRLRSAIAHNQTDSYGLPCRCR